jgi:ferric-dicitrate binding protein FerR (iron transport regulator)
MSPRELPPVEPLSADAWARIEQGVFAQLEREATPQRKATPERRVRVLSFASVVYALGAVAAAAVLALWLGVDREPAAPAQAVATAVSAEAAPAALPAATVAPVDEPALAPAPSAPRRLEHGAHVRTGDVAERLLIGDSEVVLAPSSELGVEGSDEHGWLLELVRGRIDCQVAARAERPDFVTRAGQVEVRVVGTRFSVEHDAGGDARVNVQEGKVRVSQHRRSVLLTAGESWSGFERPPASRIGSSSMKRTAAADRARFERATRLESAEPAKALRIYGELSARSGPWAANALYAAGRLELERGNLGRARTLLKRYLKRYPDGANVSDAKALLAR